MSNNITTRSIVDHMQNEWTSLTNGSFHFGMPQEIDNIHNKTLPIMIVYPPTCQIKMDDIRANHGLMNCQWELVVYDNVPSTYEVKNDKTILTLWDTMENYVIVFYQELFKEIEREGRVMNMTSPLQFTRLQNATNDQLLGIKLTFGADFFRRCIEIK